MSRSLSFVSLADSVRNVVCRSREKVFLRQVFDEPSSSKLPIHDGPFTPLPPPEHHLGRHLCPCRGIGRAAARDYHAGRSTRARCIQAPETGPACLVCRVFLCGDVIISCLQSMCRVGAVAGACSGASCARAELQRLECVPFVLSSFRPSLFVSLSSIFLSPFVRCGYVLTHSCLGWIAIQALRGTPSGSSGCPAVLSTPTWLLGRRSLVLTVSNRRGVQVVHGRRRHGLRLRIERTTCGV
jgi:hypothetical protein